MLLISSALFTRLNLTKSLLPPWTMDDNCFVPRIEVLGFEVANVIVRAINLRQSLLDRDIEDLHNEVLASEGIHMLVSDDMYHVWGIAAEDKR